MTAFETAEQLETVELKRAGGVALIELARPETMNAWNEQFGHDLGSVVKRVADDPEVRSVLVTGQGRGFSSGADLKAGFEPDANGRPDVYTRLTELYHPIITGLRRMPKPVVAAVNGPAVGIGCSLALCCDLVLVAESAYFLLAFINIGLVPDGGSSVFVPARIGKARAIEMAMLGERIPAQQAVEWGLANRVVADDQLISEAEALAERLAAGPTAAYAGLKRELNQAIYANMDEQLELEARLQSEMAGSADFVEGVTAFIQKRPPNFTGS